MQRGNSKLREAQTRGAISRLWLLLYWAAVAAVAAGSWLFQQPVVNVFLLAPILFLTYFFWRDRLVLATHLPAVVVAAGLPLLQGGDRGELGSAFVTVPVLVLIGMLVGGLADRLRGIRTLERGRFNATIEALCTALTARDGYTGEHSRETLSLVSSVCEELGLADSECCHVADVALLHDIGKIGIPNDILHAPGKLSPAQWEVMKTHPEVGERIVERIPGLEEVARAIRHEHERWDGTGYPDGLAGLQIPLASRIVLACDAYHAMTSDRPYRKSIGVAEARAELRRHAATQFDPEVVGALLAVTDGAERAERGRAELSRVAAGAVVRVIA